MADISISQRHALPHRMAKAAAQTVADQMAEEYDMTSEWQGDVLSFRRAGVSGMLALHDNEARLEINLGFLFKAFAPTIEARVARKMQSVFCGQA